MYKKNTAFMCKMRSCIFYKPLLIMKLTFILWIAAFLQVSAAGYAQKVNITIKNAPLQEVINQLKIQTDYDFLCSSEIFEGLKPITIKAINKDLQQVLNECFKGLPLQYQINNKTVVITLKDEPVKTSNPQKKITGRVVDEKGQPLPSVSVQVKGTNIGTVTDPNGAYAITAPSPQSILVFNFIGFAPQEIEVLDKTQITAVLKEQSSGLQEIVVVGYGTQIKKNITGSISKVDMKKTEDLPNNNVMQAVRGRVAGVQFLDGARPGQNGSILVRGPKSLSASNSPLIILDGIFYNGSLTDISTNDIESMEILKDASASAIYGSRAANGVILITSKRGKSEVPEIKINAYTGFSDWSYIPKLLSPERYVQRILDYRTQANLPANPSQITSYLSTSEVENYLAGMPLDPWKEASQDGKISALDVNISGKAKKIDYFFSASDNREKGLIYNDNWKRTSLRGFAEASLRDWLKVGFNVNYSNRDASGYNNTANLQFVVVSSPYGTWYHEDGEPTQFPVIEENAATNPMRTVLLRDNQYILNNLFANFYTTVNVPFIKGLTYRLNYAPNYRWSYENNFFRQDKYLAQNTTYANKWNQKIVDHVVENILTYNKQINKDHAFDLTLLYGSNKQLSEDTRASANLLSSEVLGWNNLELGSVFTNTSSATQVNGISSMFRLNYRYKDKYMLTVTARRDGSSVFAANNKYAFFPSGSFAWILSEEPFLKDKKNINVLKLRLSYGAVGNQAISPYQSLSLVEQIQYTFADRLTSLGLYTSGMANSDLKWETTYTANLGLDFEFFKGRLSGVLEFYNMDTRNLLVERALPTITGFNSVMANLGQVNNKGIEFTLNTVNISKKDFSWSTDFVFSHNKNKIVHLYYTDTNGDGIEDDDITNKWFIGKPMNVAYDYVFDGIYQEGETMPQGYKAGFVKLKDIDGDGQITAADRAILGQDGEPKFRYGLGNNFKYKNFTLSVFVNFAQGWLGQFNAMSPTTSAAGRSLNQLDAGWWTAQNKSNTMPSLVYNNPYGHGYYLNRNFIRLQDVSLSYALPNHLLQKAKINSAKIFVSGKNLATITDWLGPDPESGRTSTGDLYPRSRNFTMGFNVAF